MTPPPPNFFCYGKDERTQDAVICWLIAWAARPDPDPDPKNKEERRLRACGLRFVEALLSHKRDVRISLTDEIDVEIFQQAACPRPPSATGRKRRPILIDVLVRITQRGSGRQYVLLIEDKVGADKASASIDLSKLTDYYRCVVDGKTCLGETPPTIVYPIFLQTGNQSPLLDLEVENAIENPPNGGYKIFRRRDFLTVLDGCKDSHYLTASFRAHLCRIEDDTESYRGWTRENRDDWTGHGWQGLFMRLEKEMRKRKVHENRNGGQYGWMDWKWVALSQFWGFFWEPPGGADGLYLQIEGEDELRFRINGKRIPAEDEPKAFAMKWLDRLLRACGDLIEKVANLSPKRDGSFAFAKWKGPWMVFDERTGLLDVDASIDNLRKAEACLRKAVEDARKEKKN